MHSRACDLEVAVCSMAMQPFMMCTSDHNICVVQQQGIYDGSCTASTLNHAVVAVGYGAMSTGEEYWILRNQWGASWGADGYIYLPISYNDDSTGGACGLLGGKNDFPAAFPSMAEAASNALTNRLFGGLASVAVLGVLLLVVV